MKKVYEVGVKFVDVDWYDDYLVCLKYEKVDEFVFSEFFVWKV